MSHAMAQLFRWNRVSNAMSQLFRFNHPITGKSQKVSTPIIAKVIAIGTLSSAEAPAGYPYRNSNNKKNRKSAGDEGKRKKAGASLLSFPFPSCATRSLFSFCPASLQHKEVFLRRREAIDTRGPTQYLAST